MLRTMKNGVGQGIHRAGIISSAVVDNTYAKEADGFCNFKVVVTVLKLCNLKIS